ncbi:MAG: S-methyl-5-thioribose-1-phosphate isomerase [Christensenella sp.]|uniref:S-methyl-5-thioribose-1-phosphate isomerase n=1 Tax=Christensenella sp. TaxID=1935934 RepID=UPI002B20D768|nr:S-methyl-5-thioribose-1-phosphate isomerase [Christensenella sp.]MEA5003221.1 S-methyl-5-thioribose-1-phosphate isomerase [Christensenella sp.]
MKQSIMDYDTVALDDQDSALVIIDQTQLPYNTEILHLKDQKSIWDAIYLLQVRGAPAIGVAAAIGIYLAAKEIQADSFDDFYAQFVKAKEYLDSARPTAVNLSWALNRMDDVVRANKDKSVAEIKEILHQQAVAIKEEDTWVCKTIGEYGLSLLKPEMGLLTHCNAGQLATSKYGTATAPMYLGHEKGYNFRVFCDETRPLLQGARLTSYELHESGIDTTLICDNMAPSVMKKGWVDAVFVGCDRVAKNGDTANKIGTSYVAMAAKYYDIPFYVCAPTSTIDMNCESGDDIHIELRPAEEVTEMWYEKRMAPEGVKVFYPAFDVTDAQNITGIITEYGIAYAPFEESLKEIFRKKEAAAKK